MGTALAIAGFELRTKLARISTAVYFAVFGALATLWMAAAGGVFESLKVAFSSDKVFINSPYAIAQTVTVLGLLGVVTVAAFMGRAIQQDFEHLTSHFFFTEPSSASSEMPCARHSGRSVRWSSAERWVQCVRAFAALGTLQAAVNASL